MGTLRLIAAAILAASMSACGGGGGSESGAPAGTGTGGQMPAPAPTISLSTAPITAQLAAGDELPQTLEGAITYTADLPLYVQVRDAGGAFTLPAVQAAPADKRVALDISMRTTLPAGVHTGTLEVRLCKDAACAQTFDGASASVAYSLTLAQVADWTTHQRDARHSGEVPIRLNPARFSKAWEWMQPTVSGVSMGINPVVTKAGKVFVTTDVYFGDASLYALKESDGSVAWTQSMGNVPAFNPPAVSGSKVYAAVTGHGDTFLWAFDLETGQYQHKSGFNGQWPHFLAPTVADDVVYQGSGYYGGEVMAVSTLDGSRQWLASLGGGWDMFTPAVSGSQVFHHTGVELVALDKASGAVQARIADPFGSLSGSSYHAAPIVGGRNNVVAFAGLAFSGLASANAEQYDQRKLSSFDIVGNRYEWSTAATYLTAPALGNGVIYAARNAPMGLDAIDEVTGQVRWTWTAPSAGDTEFHRNVVLTRSHLFVSTNSNVYAVDLTTRRSVWSYPAPGMLAISADRTLYIATGANRSDGGLVAIRLK